MSKTATQILRLSDRAADIDRGARAYAHRISDRIGDACHSTIRGVYLGKVAALVSERMREELEPYERQLVKLAGLSLSPVEAPPDMSAAMEDIRSRWLAVHAELAGAQEPTP